MDGLTPETLLEESKKLGETGAQRNAALQEKAKAESASYQGKLADMGQKVQAGYDDLKATPAPGVAALPEPDTGPIIDPKAYETFAQGMLALSLIGAVAGRSHWNVAGAALDGAIKGFVQGNMEVARQKKEEFDRSFKTAQAKQAEMNKQYQQIIDSKKLTLTQMMAQLKVAAAQHQDEAMLHNVQQHDIDAIFKQQGSMMKMAEQMQVHKDNIEDRVTARREKAQAAREKADSGSGADAVESMAWDYLIRGHNPPARGGAYEKTMAKVAEIAKENGMSTQDLVSASADVKTKLAAKRTFETRVQNLTRAENQLSREIPVMEDAMKAMNAPSIPLAARGKIAVLRGMGDPNVTKLDQAAEAVLDEFQGIITGNPGTLNVSDVQKAQETYHKIQTPQQMKAWIDGARRIIANAKSANDETRDEIMKGIGSSVNPRGRRKADAQSPRAFASEADAAAANLPPGTKITIGGVAGTWQ